MQNSSDVARILESIKLSYESAYLALHGPAMVSKHEFITKKMAAIRESHTVLQTLVGEKEALQLVVETMTTIQEASHTNDAAL